jgi:hypothetical protein
LERVKTEADQVAMEDLYRLNYTLGFFHKYWGEEDIAAEYYRSVEDFLHKKYSEDHNKIRKFYELTSGVPRGFHDGDHYLHEGEHGIPHDESNIPHADN